MQIEVPVLSFISALLVLFPLPWYFRAHNIAAMSIGVWLFIVNIVYAIDALQWTGSLLWCDISKCPCIKLRTSVLNISFSFSANNGGKFSHTLSMPLYLHPPGTDGIFLPNVYLRSKATPHTI